MTYIVIGAIIIVFILITIAIIDHIFESNRYDDGNHEVTTVIVQHTDGENNTSIGVQNNYDSDE